MSLRNPTAQTEEARGDIPQQEATRNSSGIKRRKLAGNGIPCGALKAATPPTPPNKQSKQKPSAEAFTSRSGEASVVGGVPAALGDSKVTTVRGGQGMNVASRPLLGTNTVAARGTPIPASVGTAATRAAKPTVATVRSPGVNTMRTSTSSGGIASYLTASQIWSALYPGTSLRAAWEAQGVAVSGVSTANFATVRTSGSSMNANTVRAISIPRMTGISRPQMQAISQATAGGIRSVTVSAPRAVATSAVRGVIGTSNAICSQQIVAGATTPAGTRVRVPIQRQQTASSMVAAAANPSVSTSGSSVSILTSSPKMTTSEVTAVVAGANLNASTTPNATPPLNELQKVLEEKTLEFEKVLAEKTLEFQKALEKKDLELHRVKEKNRQILEHLEAASKLCSIVAVTQEPAEVDDMEQSDLDNLHPVMCESDNVGT